MIAVLIGTLLTLQRRPLYVV